jgi:hypothetical protein
MDMSEPATLTVISFLIVMATLVTGRRVMAARIQQAARDVMLELERNEAYDPFTAIELGVDRVRPRRIWCRSFRPTAVDILAREGILKRTGAGKFYIRRRVDGRLLKCTEETCREVP